MIPLRSTFVLVLALTALAACGRASDTQGTVTVSAASKPAAAAPPLPKPPQAKYQRDLYAKLADCVTDWGFAGKCTPLASDAPERAQGATFFGPIYSNALRFESQLVARREAVDQGYQAQLDENPTNRAIASAEIKS